MPGPYSSRKAIKAAFTFLKQNAAFYGPFALGAPALTFVGSPFFNALEKVFPQTSSWRLRAAQGFFKKVVDLLEFSGAVKVEYRMDAGPVLERTSVYAANHPSLLDVILLMAVVPRATCLLKSTDWTAASRGERNRRMPRLWGAFLDAAVNSMGYIPMPADLSAKDALVRVVRDCTRALEAGRSLVIFPEGTRSKPGGMLPFNQLAFKSAINAGVPVVPVTISPSRAVMAKGQRAVMMNQEPVRFVVRFSSPLEPGPGVKAADLGFECRRVIARGLADIQEKLLTVKG